MKRILVLCVLICSSYVLYGQELKFERFYADMTMTDAAQYPKKDANGVNCGLIKLSLVIPDAEFEGDIIATEYKNGEWLIYMMNGANWITIKTPQYLPLRRDLSPAIESNITYVMVVEIPPNDSTDYFLEQARQAFRRNKMEKFIQYVEKVPKDKIPNDLLEDYEKALLAREENELYDRVRKSTKGFTKIQDEDTYKLCQSFMVKYSNSAHYQEVSSFMSTEGVRFRQGQISGSQRPQAPSSTSTSVSSAKKITSNKPAIRPSSQNNKQGKNVDRQHLQSTSPLLTPNIRQDEPFVSVGIGIEPFIFIPEDYEEIEIEDCGIAANAVIRIGRPKSLINGMLGVGASTGSYIESNLHATSELRVNFGVDDDDSYFLGIGADIPLLSFNSTTENSETAGVISSESCLKILVGYRKKKTEFNIGARIWESSIGGAVCIGFRWFLF